MPKSRLVIAFALVFAVGGCVSTTPNKPTSSQPAATSGANAPAPIPPTSTPRPNTAGYDLAGAMEQSQRRVYRCRVVANEAAGEAKDQAQMAQVGGAALRAVSSFVPMGFGATLAGSQLATSAQIGSSQQGQRLWQEAYDRCMAGM